MDKESQQNLGWGILGTAKIARNSVIPAIQDSRYGRVVSIASRNLERARIVASGHGIPRAYGTYEELLSDSEVDVVYIPLPNHLHVPWTKRAAEAGKHVLCEKPIATTAVEAEELLDLRDKYQVQIQEAFMVRTHPQWTTVKEIVSGGEFGELRAIYAFFSYYLDDPNNIRSHISMGGGGMLDIGCYPVTMSRVVTGAEPSRVVAMLERDPNTGIDRLGSAILDFPGVQATFTYSTQLVEHQRMTFIGTKGRVEVEIPFNAPSDRPCRLFIHGGSLTAEPRILEIDVTDQYTVAADAFTSSILDSSPQPIPLEDSIDNMRVLDALFLSAETNSWRTP